MNSDRKYAHAAASADLRLVLCGYLNIDPYGGESQDVINALIYAVTEGKAAWAFRELMEATDGQ